MSELLDAVLDTPATTDAPADLMDDFVSSLTSETPPATDTPPADTPPATEEKPAETPKTEETPPATEEEVPAEPKNRKDWDTLRGSRDRWKQTAEEVQTAISAKEQALQTLNAQIEELQAKASRLPELEEKIKLLDEYEKELAVTRIEATREYKETIAQPLQVIGQTADTLAKANETDPERVFEMIREADPAKQRTVFKEITSGWDEVDRSELWAMAKDARVILDKQDMMREHAASAAKEQADMAAKREQAQKEAFQKEFTAGLKDVVKTLREKTPFVPVAEGETEDDRYLSLEQKVAAVDFDSQTPRAKAFAAAAAIERPQLIRTIQKLQDELETYKARTKADNSSKASVSPSEQSHAPADEGQDFLTALGVPQSPMLSHALNVVGV